MNIRWRHQPRAEWEGQTMVLRQPTIRWQMTFAIIALFPPLMLIASIARRADNPLTGPMIALGAVVFGFAAWTAWAIGSRTITISQEAAELRGLWGRRIAWSDLENVEGFVLPKRSFVIFTGKNGKAIAVDSTLYGWEEFVEKAPALARNAGPSLSEAIRRVEGTPR